MLENYYLHAFLTGNTVIDHNPITRLLNPAIEVINRKPRLPRHMIILIDEKLVKLGELVEVTIRWLLMEMWCTILARIDQLPVRAKPLYDTLITIIKPLPRPDTCDPYGYYLQDKRRTNRALEKHVKCYKFRTVQNMDSIVPQEPNYFLQNGKLSARGMTQFWLFINELVRMVDAHVPLKQQTNTFY